MVCCLTSDLETCLHADNLMLLGKNLHSPISGKWLLEVAASCWSEFGCKQYMVLYQKLLFALAASRLERSVVVCVEDLSATCLQTTHHPL